MAEKPVGKIKSSKMFTYYRDYKRTPPCAIIGIDQSMTSTGMTLLVYTNNKIATQTYRVMTDSAYSTPARISYIIKHIQVLLETATKLLEEYPEPIILITIEGYAMGVRNGQVFTLAELGGSIKQYLYWKGADVLTVPPTCLKTFLNIKGNAKKEDVKLGVYKKYKEIEFDNNDETDSFVLANIGLAYLGNQVEEELTAYEMKSVLGSSFLEGVRTK